MVDKVIKLDNGLEYYVMELLVCNKNVYFLCVQVDGEDVKENLMVCKLYYNENNIMHISPIENTDERVEVTQKFMKLLNKEL